MAKKSPKSVWIIFDPLDGPHLFLSEKSASKTMRKWAEEASNDMYDSFWDMTGPLEYTRVIDPD